MLIDAKSNSDIQRFIEFAPDFEHFFLIKSDNQLNILTLEYYDTDLKKIWSKEFSETVSAAYDFTSTSIYVVVNNDLHILDIATGEEKIDPVYIGNKAYVRKLKDGLLMIDETSPSDAIMKTDLNGKILWKINMKENFELQDGIQVIGDNLLISGSGHYLLINNETGEIIVNAVSVK